MNILGNNIFPKLLLSKSSNRISVIIDTFNGILLEQCAIFIVILTILDEFMDFNYRFHLRLTHFAVIEQYRKYENRKVRLSIPVERDSQVY